MTGASAKSPGPQRKIERNLRRKNRELALLNRVNTKLTATLDLDQVLVSVLEEVRGMLNVSACSVWLVDPATGELVCRQSTDANSGIVCGWRLSAGTGIVGYVVERGKSLIVPDTRANARHYKGVDERFGLEQRSILCVPLQLKETTIGALQAVDTQVNRFTRSNQMLLESLASTAAIAIENARLYEQSCKDAQTKEILLHEINHRVKNNMASIIGLLYVERRHVGMAERPAYQAIMNDLINRVQGLATVHNLLSASKWNPLLLSTLTRQIVHAVLRTIPATKRVNAHIPEANVLVSPDQSNNMALIVNELATNAVKYALPGQEAMEIWVDITRTTDLIEFVFRDNGPGYPVEVLEQKQYNIGLDLIRSLVRDSLRGEVTLANDGGAKTIIRFAAA